LATWIEEILRRVTGPARPPSITVEPHRAEVRAAAPILVQARDSLRSSAPVYARGVAMLDRLLRDGGSALYLPVWRGQLRHELELIIAALEGREQP
jgi:hypothetical protein